VRAWTAGAARASATLVTVAPVAGGSILTITPPLPEALRRETTVVHANVALATHGETVMQILGAGDAAKSFQRFELKRLPLTYRSAANETGADSELSVRIGDVEWAEKPTMFGSQSTERAYTLDTDEQGRSWVVFGDGVRGARLPSGQNNVRATYRQGLGQEGNVGADALTQLMTRPLGLKSVSNPVAAEGGTDVERADDARRTMPLGTRTLGRAVSLLDYEDFALAFTGIAKAHAQVLRLPAGPTVAITVAGQDGQALSSGNPVWNNLRLALTTSGDPYVNLALLSYQVSTFRLGLKVKRDPAYEIATVLAGVEAALRAHYSFNARHLAQPVLQSEVIAVAHSVPGVLAVDLDFLYGGTLPASQVPKSRQTRLLASRMRVSGSVALPAELLTLDTAPLDRLEEMT
jgi:predicted phage baseplate assembly protein